MGAACTRIDVSPAVAKMICTEGTPNRIRIGDCRYETVWACISPHIRGAIERVKTRKLLRGYLAEHPCRERYMILHVNGRKWIFEIITNRATAEYSEVVIGWRAATNRSAA
jgi:hypothetical protein